MDLHPDPRCPVLPPRCPWYVAALMAFHFATGTALAFFGVIFLFSLFYDLLSPIALDARDVAAQALVGTLLGAAGVPYLYSGQCIRHKRRRRYSVLCGAMLCFGGPLAVIGLLTVYGLTRPLAYYDFVGQSPAFPVLPARVQ